MSVFFLNYDQSISIILGTIITTGSDSQKEKKRGGAKYDITRDK